MSTPSNPGGAESATSPLAPAAQNASNLGVRKRVDSSGEGSFLSISRGKRPRLSAMAMPSSYGERNSIGFGADRLPRPRSLFDEDPDSGLGGSTSTYYTPRRHHARPLSGASSYTVASRPPSPLYSQITGAPIGAERFHEGIALMRSASTSSLSAAAVQNYPESSAKHHLRHTRTFDYSPPETSLSTVPAAGLLTCSATNIAYFTRGSRVHCTNLNTNVNTDIHQVCKMSETRGTIRALACASGPGAADVLAIATTNGYIQLWDVRARKSMLAWATTRDITAVAWNGPVLTVGGIKGSIRHYDTRLPAAKVCEQARKLIRHHGQITALQWNEDGKLLASGDAGGAVHCWEFGQKVPLEIGEFVSRRKKIQHDGKISALSWCPWQPKLLATGDEKGILRLWNINGKDTSSNALNPGKLELRATITGVHFSPQCKEILTTHGAQIGERNAQEHRSAAKPIPENGLAVHSFPTLRHVTTYSLPAEQQGAIGDSILDATGTKLIFTTPSTNKIDVCEVWAKRKVVKQRSSFNELMIR